MESYLTIKEIAKKYNLDTNEISLYDNLEGRV